MISLSVTVAGDRPSDKRLLVIAPERFHPALKEFVRFKRKQLPTELISLEKVLTKSKGVDDPEKIKRFLYQEWRAQHLGYALLVGDADVFPVRYMVLDRVTPSAFDYAFYPCDLYYSDLAKADGGFDDWNARKDGFHAAYFGEVRGEKNKSDPINFDEVDYRPEIAVGRWPVSTIEEARLVAAKTMHYEERVLNGSVPGERRAAFLSVGGWVDSRPLLDKLAGKMPAGWSVEKRYYHDGNRDLSAPPPTEAQIDGLLNEGVGLVCHTGHGNDDAWEQCFFLSHLDRVKNSDRLPVMISIGCSTARFATLPPYEPYVDVTGKAHEGTNNKEVFTEPPPPPACYQSGRYNPSGLGEQLLRGGDNGAVAYIGCNTGSQPCALTLLEGFIDALHRAKEPRLGDCWANAVAYYYEHQRLATLKPNEDWYPPSIFFQGMKFMLFGDPSLQMPPPEREK
ncbi:MAG TPA: C25 family cysteine peptidase [Candidatus Angelobacter sp.]|nr:C25 family cysteine peptidase [Candidatus Angelobacter sp.]